MEILNQKTLKVLQSLNAIHNSVIVSYPVTCMRESKSIQAYLNLEKLGQTEAFEEFGIYDLTSFLSAVSLISEPSIQKNDNTIVIRNSNSAVSYRTSNIELLEEENRGDVSIIDRVRKNTKIGEFDLSVDDFKQIKIASNTLKDLPDLSISSAGEDSYVCLEIFGKERSSNTFEMFIKGNYDEDSKIVVTLSLLKRLPNSNYKVEIFRNNKNDAKILLFTSTDVDGLEILLSAASM